MGGIHTIIVSEKTIHPANSQLDKLDGINTAIDAKVDVRRATIQ